MGNFLARLTADVALGAFYFVVTALVAYGLATAGLYLFPDPWDNSLGPDAHYIILAGSSLLAFVIFQFRREKSLRGRGSLDEVRKNSVRFVIDSSPNAQEMRNAVPSLPAPRSHGEKLYEERPSDYWANIIADIVIRLGYFSVVAFLLLYRHLWLEYRMHHPGMYPRHFGPFEVAEEIQHAYGAWDGQSIPGYLILPVIAGGLAALLCPWMKKRSYRAGRNLPWRKPRLK